MPRIQGRAAILKPRNQRRRFLKRRTKASYRPAWRFPLIVELEIRKWILPPSLHVCSGQSTLGDVKLDLYEFQRGAFVCGATRYLPFRPRSFMTAIWDPPYSMHRRTTMPALIELRSMLKPGGRLITLHYFDPSNFLQRSTRLLYKAYYEPKGMGGVRVLTVLELLPGWRLKLGRRESLIDVTQHGGSQLVEVSAGMWEPKRLTAEVPLA